MVERCLAASGRIMVGLVGLGAPGFFTGRRIGSLDGCLSGKVRLCCILLISKGIIKYNKVGFTRGEAVKGVD